MANSRGMGLRRGQGFPLRLSEDERVEFKRRATEANLSMVDYARCKILDIPVRYFAGRQKDAVKKKRRAKPQAQPTIDTAS